jgi:hypothetical protein
VRTQLVSAGYELCGTFSIISNASTLVTLGISGGGRGTGMTSLSGPCYPLAERRSKQAIAASFSLASIPLSQDRSITFSVVETTFGSTATVRISGRVT